MARDSNGLRFQDQMKIGLDELQWLQDELAERAAVRLAGQLHEAGWVGEFLGITPQFGWEIVDAGSRVLAIQALPAAARLDQTRPDADGSRPWLAVDRTGRVLEFRAGELPTVFDTSIVVPDDGVWRTLVARYAVTPRAPGSISFTAGSATVVGVGTEFTRYADGVSVGAATRVRIASADSAGNDGDYVFATIVDDTNATLNRPAQATETGIRFRVRSSFFGSEPGLADLDGRWEVNVLWELVTRTTTRPTDALIAYDVQSTAGVVSLIDRRHASVAQAKIGQNTSYRLMPQFPAFWYPDGINDAVRLGYLNPVGAPAGIVLACSFAPMQGGDHLPGSAMAPATMLAILANDTGTYRVRVLEQIPFNDFDEWDHIDDGGAVEVVSGATVLTDASLIALPAGSALTHMLFYVSSAGSLFYKTSADNGATWSSATTVVTAVDMTRVSACVTRLGRIILFTCHNVAPFLRHAYSDDLGTTWDLDAGALYDFGQGDSSVVDVGVAEDDRGNLWMVAASDLSDTIVNGAVMWRSTAEGDATPINSTNYRVGKITTVAQPYTSVDVVALPNGHVAVAGGTTAGTHVTLVARRRVMCVSTFASNNLTAGQVAIGYAPDGTLQLAADNPDENDVFVISLVPVPIHRPFAAGLRAD